MIFPPGCKWWHSICFWPIKIQRPEISQKHQLLLESKGSESINMPQQISHFLRHIYLKDTYLSAEIRLHVFQKKQLMKPMGFLQIPNFWPQGHLDRNPFLVCFFQTVPRGWKCRENDGGAYRIATDQTKIQGLVSLGIPNMFHLGRRNTIMQTALVRDYVSFLRGISWATLPQQCLVVSGSPIRW